MPLLKLFTFLFGFVNKVYIFVVLQILKIRKMKRIKLKSFDVILRALISAIELRNYVSDEYEVEYMDQTIIIDLNFIYDNFTEIVDGFPIHYSRAVSVELNTCAVWIDNEESKLSSEQLTELLKEIGANDVGSN